METEGVTLEFDDGAIDEIAKISFNVNEQVENIGARRLLTVMEKDGDWRTLSTLLEEKKRNEQDQRLDLVATTQRLYEK